MPAANRGKNLDDGNRNTVQIDNNARQRRLFEKAGYLFKAGTNAGAGAFEKVLGERKRQVPVIAAANYSRRSKTIGIAGHLGRPGPLLLMRRCLLLRVAKCKCSLTGKPDLLSARTNKTLR